MRGGRPGTHTIKKQKGGFVIKKRDLYIYAHNMSKFDGLFIIRAILQGEGKIQDEMKSNGRYVSFRFKNLVFRDSLLITMTSLKHAANSYGCESSKGYLPHRYLQNVSCRTEVLRRINERVSWLDLKHAHHH